MMLMLVVPEVFRGRSGFMLAIARGRRPAELERQ